MQHRGLTVGEEHIGRRRSLWCVLVGLDAKASALELHDFGRERSRRAFLVGGLGEGQDNKLLDAVGTFSS